MSDPYVYQGTNILVNRFDLRNQRELERRDRLITFGRMRQQLPDIKLTPRGFAKVHAHIFGDVYPWAGKFRECDLAKGDSFFCRPHRIEAEMHARMARIDRDRNLSSESISAFSSAAAGHVSELNAIHPFREGNGRAMRKLVDELARRNDMRLSLDGIDREEWDKASILAFKKGDTTRLQAIFEANIELDVRQRQLNRRRERQMQRGLER